MSHQAERPVHAEPRPSVTRLAFGLNLAADVMLLIDLVFFLFDAHRYPYVGLNIAAWVLLLAVVALSQLELGRLVRLPANWYGIARIAFAVVLVLDVFGTLGATGSNVTGPFPTAAVGIGAGLLTFVTLQSRRSVLMAAGATAVLLAIDLLFTASGPLVDVAPGIVTIAMSLVPPIIGVEVVRAFGQMVSFQSDLSQAKGTTSGAGLGLGQSASADIVALDLQAERLLEDVASGRAALPLSAQTAELASDVAARLRLSLVAGKAETWLHHALTESSVLGPISTIDDPDGLAAQLAPDQRDGLLTAVWMLVGDGERLAQALTVTVRRATGAGAQTQRLAITIELIGVPKRRIDPAAWHAIGRVGRYSEQFEAPTLRIDVDCPLDVVADR